MEPIEGYVKILGFNLFYRTYGRPTKGTVLCLHGGPGATHDYLLSLEDLAQFGYRVVLIDQLGCGKSEALKDYRNPKYLAAVDVFYRRYVCRLPVWPREVTYSFEHLSGPVYFTMNGPNEFTIIGTIKDWDVTDQLPTIHLPTLVTVGRYDEVTPRVAESIHRGIKGSKLVRFEKSAHLAMWEERSHYIEVLRDFLDGVRPA